MAIVLTESFKAERMNAAGKYQLTQQEWNDNVFTCDGIEYLRGYCCIILADVFVVVGEIKQYANPHRVNLYKRAKAVAKCEGIYKHMKAQLTAPGAEVEEVTRVDDNWEYTQVWHGLPRTPENAANMQYMLDHLVDWQKSWTFHGFQYREGEFMLMDNEKVYFMTVSGHYLDRAI